MVRGRLRVVRERLSVVRDERGEKEAERRS